MAFELKTTASGVVLILEGDLGIRHAGLLWDALQPVLAGGGEVCIQAQELEEMDTSIIQILCRASNSAARLEIGGISDGFQSSLRRRGLENFFVKLPAGHNSQPEAKVVAKKQARRSKPRKDGQQHG
jgi:anti-anti-sigma regulatory factor